MMKWAICVLALVRAEEQTDALENVLEKATKKHKHSPSGAALRTDESRRMVCELVRQL